MTADVDRSGGSLYNQAVFRVAFGLFYLWHLSFVFVGDLAAIPEAEWYPVGGFVVLGRPSAGMMIIAELVLVGALVMLVFGLKTRWVTVVVLLVGLIVDGHHQSFRKIEHGTVFLSFYIPLIMTISRWGAMVSIDAMLSRKRGEQIVVGTPSDKLPEQALLTILGFLFLTAAWSKALDGPWLSESTGLCNAATTSRVLAELYGVVTPPAHLWFCSVIGQVGSVAVVLLQSTFLLALVKRLRPFYVAAALSFHAGNALLLGVTFTPILAVYLSFVDWASFVPNGRRSARAEALPAQALTAMPVVLAVIVAGLWSTTAIPQSVINLGGILNWQTIWIPVLGGLLAVPFVRSLPHRSRIRKADGPHD